MAGGEELSLYGSTPNKADSAQVSALLEISFSHIILKWRSRVKRLDPNEDVGQVISTPVSPAADRFYLGFLPHWFLIFYEEQPINNPQLTSFI